MVVMETHQEMFGTASYMFTSATTATSAQRAMVT